MDLNRMETHAQEHEHLGEELFRRYRKGESVEQLADYVGKSKKSVRRVIAKAWLRRIRELPLTFVSSDEFERPQAKTTIMAPMPTTTVRRVKAPAGMPPYLAALYETPLLSAEQERHLFRKYNYLKFRASELRARLDPTRPSLRQMEQIDRLYRQAERTREHLARANLRLVVSLAKRFVSSSKELPELISDGNISLLKAIDKFDYSKGFKFSTYASWAIMNNFRRNIASDLKRAGRYQTSYDEALSAKSDYRADPHRVETAHSAHQRDVRRLMRDLDSRERNVISGRFGLDYGKEPKTLKEVGEQLGVSKERARQLEQRALRKLRESAETPPEN